MKYLGNDTMRLWLGFVFAALAGLAVLMCTSLFFDRNDVDEWTARLAGVTPVIIIHALVACVAVIVRRRRHLPLFTRGLEVMIALSAIGWCIVAWKEGSDRPVRDQVTLNALSTLSLLGGGGALIGILLSSPLQHPTLARLRTGLLGSSLLLIASVILFMWSRIMQSHGLVLTITGGLGALGVAVCAPALLVMMYWMRVRRRRMGGSIERHLEIALSCPDCGTGQICPTGLSRCAGCSVALIIEVEEPRCECGYLVYRIVGDSCPECGRAIAPEVRWAADVAAEHATVPTPP